MRDISNRIPNSSLNFFSKTYCAAVGSKQTSILLKRTRIGRKSNKCTGITKRRTGPENRTANGKVVSTPYWLNDFFFFPKDTISVNFTFAAKVQQCLVTGSKWNIFLTNTELKSINTLMWFCVHCVNLYGWTFPVLCKYYNFRCSP